jgi:hypothetical protein
VSIPHPESTELNLYEERITLWRAASFEDAVARAESEAKEYASDVGGRYVKLAQAYHLAIDGDVGDGSEVYSLMRESTLKPDDYLNRFFDTGSERAGDIE